MVVGEEAYQPDVCFKCGKPFGKGERVVWTQDWDAWCHVECCPAFCPWLRPDEECRVCHIYQSRHIAGALRGLHKHTSWWGIGPGVIE